MHVVPMLALLLGLIFENHGAQGQATWQSGYLVGNNLDTTKGWIKYNKNWRFLPPAISFSADSIHPQSLFLDLSKFAYLEITGVDAFQRVWLDKDDRPWMFWPPDIRLWSPGPPPAQGWARIIVQGVPYSLYSYDDGYNPELLFVNPFGASLIMLVDEAQQPDYAAMHNPALNWKLQRPRKVYQVQLEELARKNEVNASINEAIGEAAYEREAIKAVVLEMNKATGLSSFVRKPDNQKMKIIVGGGMAFCRGQFLADRIALPDYYFQPSFNAYFSFGADYTRAHWTSRNELGYCPYLFRGYATSKVRGAGGHFTAQLNNINFTSSFLYAADHEKRFRPYGGAGLIISYTITNKVDFYEAPSYLSTPEFIQGKMLWTPTVKLGITFNNRFDCCLNYTYRETFPLVDKVKLRTSIFSLWLGMAIKKTHL